MTCGYGTTSVLGMETSPESHALTPATPVRSRKPPSPSRVIAWAALVLAIVGLAAGWFATTAGPAAGRQAIARGDIENAFTVLIAAWSMAMALNVAAIILGAVGARRPEGKVLSGVAIGIAAAGTAGLVAYPIQTGLIGYLL